jgi:predicted nucleic acid-binding Zn ribbon protein
VECGAPVRKVLHPVGISFKGSGFYSTDYGKKSPQDTGTKDSTTTNGDKGTKEKKDKKDKEKPAGTSTSSGNKD